VTLRRTRTPSVPHAHTHTHYRTRPMTRHTHDQGERGGHVPASGRRSTS
jgi:hypothetical protein